MSAKPAIKASPGQAPIDMPAVQADTGSRNANKAGWRGLLRARVLGQAGGSWPVGEACTGALGLGQFGVFATQAADKAPSLV